MSNRTLPVPDLPVAPTPASATANASPLVSSSSPVRLVAPRRASSSRGEHFIKAEGPARSVSPRFQPLDPYVFDCNNHPLAIRRPVDILRFFPITITMGAGFAAASGFLAGKIIDHFVGYRGLPTIFVGVYLSLYLLCLLTHYPPAKGKLFFTSIARFTRVTMVNALLTIPHYFAHLFVIGMPLTAH